MVKRAGKSAPTNWIARVLTVPQRGKDFLSGSSVLAFSIWGVRADDGPDEPLASMASHDTASTSSTDETNTSSAQGGSGVSCDDVRNRA